MANFNGYGGELDLMGEAAGQVAFYGGSDATRLNFNYVNGKNAIEVSGIQGTPPASQQDPGSNKTYDVSNPGAGVLVKYNGTLTLQWNWES